MYTKWHKMCAKLRERAMLFDVLEMYCKLHDTVEQHNAIAHNYNRKHEDKIKLIYEVIL